MARNAVFFSYSHADAKWLAALQKVLKPALKDLQIDAWADTDMKAGEKWRTEIERAITRARVGVLLVSSDFLASDFVAKHELPPLLEAAEHDGLTILWVYVGACMYTYTPIAEYQAAHDISKPLNMLKPAHRQLVLVSIGHEIVAAYNNEKPLADFFIERPVDEIPPPVER